MAEHFPDATKKVDFIKQEAASDKLYKLPCKIDDDGYRWVLSRDVAHMIDGLPAADVRPVVRGKWVRGNENRTSPIKDSYICSVCGEKTLSGFCGNPAKTNFCPNCGADMREPNLDTTKGDQL